MGLCCFWCCSSSSSSSSSSLSLSLCLSLSLSNSNSNNERPRTTPPPGTVAHCHPRVPQGAASCASLQCCIHFHTFETALYVDKIRQTRFSTTQIWSREVTRPELTAMKDHRVLLLVVAGAAFLAVLACCYRSLLCVCMCVCIGCRQW